MKRRFPSSAFIVALLAAGQCLSGMAAAQTQEYKEHTVVKGDTLWGISSQEITDPFLWPKVWKENPEIRNPDLIYPGQRVRIPLHLLQKEVAPRPVEKATEKAAAGDVPGAAVAGAVPGPAVATAPSKAPAQVARKVIPVEKKYLVEPDALMASGYIADVLPGKGRVIGAPTERSLFGKGDVAYIQTDVPAEAGDRFYVLRNLGKVRHPETREMLGYLIEITGIAEVVGREGEHTKARVETSFKEVMTGDMLGDYYELEEPFLTDDPRMLNIAGYIVATKQQRVINTQYDIVFIDRGRRDGVEIGDIIGTISRNKYEVPNGTIQVIATKERTATAVVRKVEKEVTVGDKIGSL